MPVAVLLTVAGLHAPVIGGEFVELAARVGAVAFSQNAGIAVNDGVIVGLMVIV